MSVNKKRLVYRMITFRVILAILFIEKIVDGSLNLYETDDCFYHYINSDSVDFRLDHSIKQMMKYCIRIDENLTADPRTYTKSFTFAQLAQSNITVEQLLLWSATIDLIERYSYYLNQPMIHSSLSMEDVFYNCTNPWFGSRCQYSFGTNKHRSFSSIVQMTFNRFQNYDFTETIGESMNLTCYTHLKCNRGATFLCLDWREICNGQIECIDNGEDEIECWQMEINECHEDEFRCDNGMCISKDFWQDDPNNPDCLDRSDELDDPSLFDMCFQDPTFRCEEHMCRPGKDNFVCGDGQCVAKFLSCKNIRSALFKKSFLKSNELDYNCEKYYSCFTMIQSVYASDDCRIVLSHLSVDEPYYPKNCEPFIQFPIDYVLNGHIRYLYTNHTTVTFISQKFINGTLLLNDHDLFFRVDTRPLSSYMKDWNYFNQHVHGVPKDDHILTSIIPFRYFGLGLYPSTPSMFYNLHAIFNYRPSRIFRGPDYWIEGDTMVARYFRILLPDYICYDRNRCSHIKPTFKYKNLTCVNRSLLNLNFDEIYDFAEFNSIIENYFHRCSHPYKINRTHSSVYCCQNSTKCISKHRLLDNIIDCPFEDDKNYNISSSLNQRTNDLNQIYFQQICNGIVDINGIEYTDETECDHWPCKNIYTTCDGFWACADGQDENNCIQSNCPPRSQPCISLKERNTVICLPHDRINNGIIDCMGASDEKSYCRNKNNSLLDKNNFFCRTQQTCLQIKRECNDDKCSLDEKLDGCSLRLEACLYDFEEDYIFDQSVFCQLFKINKNYPYFSLETSPRYPSHSQSNETIRQRRSIESFDEETNETDDSTIEENNLCNRGVFARTSYDMNQSSYICFCPPSYYGHSCQYQNQRVSLTLRFLPVDRHTIYAIVVKLIDQYDQLHSYEQFTFMALWGCKIKFNIYLLYSTRPKNESNTYHIQIDAYDKTKLQHNASWYLPIPFAFLPVNRLAKQLILPTQQTINSYLCNLTCYNGGSCQKYENTQLLFCHCPTNWTGRQCQISVKCDDCGSDSICIGSIDNRSICLCSINKVGPRCLLSAKCPSNACQNNGQCVLTHDHIGTNNHICMCSEEFHGSRCEKRKRRLSITFDNILLPSHVQVYISTVLNTTQPSTIVMLRKFIQNQKTLLFYLSKSYHMVFVKSTNDYYLAASQSSEFYDLSTSISSKQRCYSIHELFNSTIQNLPSVRRVKYYPLICREQSSISCFYDETYMCLCASGYLPNCFHFDHQTVRTCKQIGYCQNNGLCLQDDPTCPSDRICICSDCYFGSQCQFYAKGFGLTLDDILRYEIQPNRSFFNQSLIVIITGLITILFFSFGLISGTISCLIFKRQKCKQIGCGFYLLASSRTSILTICMFTLKYCFLILSQLNIITNRTILHIGCISIDPLLKIFLYTENWFNACVAIERAYAVLKKIQFNKKSSVQMAKRLIYFIPLLIILSFLHEFLHRNLFDDKEEHRTWCVNYYSNSFQYYNSTILFIHFLAPFTINLLSALFVIINGARQHTKSQRQQTYFEHLRKEFRIHKHMLISPLVLVILSSPRLIISLISSCIKSSRNPSLFLFAYLISFVPSMLVFVVFVLPSNLYKRELKESVKTWRR